MEAFNRAPEDVSLKRLVSFGLSPQLKNQFEQIFAAPFLIELVLAELGPQSSSDTLVRLHFDGSFELSKGGVMVVAMDREKEARDWLGTQIRPNSTGPQLFEKFAIAWTLAKSGDPFSTEVSFASIEPRWKKETEGREIEVGLLDRKSEKQSKFRSLKPEDLQP
jgi:proteasome alpha subunit